MDRCVKCCQHEPSVFRPENVARKLSSWTATDEFDIADTC